MITSLINMLHLPNFGCMTTSTTKFESPDKNFVGDVMDKTYDVITLFETAFILRKFRVATFAEIIKIVTIFTKKILKDSKKVKRIRSNQKHLIS